MLIAIYKVDRFIIIVVISVFEMVNYSFMDFDAFKKMIDGIVFRYIKFGNRTTPQTEVIKYIMPQGFELLPTFTSS